MTLEEGELARKLSRNCSKTDRSSWKLFLRDKNVYEILALIVCTFGVFCLRIKFKIVQLEGNLSQCEMEKVASSTYLEMLHEYCLLRILKTGIYVFWRLMAFINSGGNWCDTDGFIIMCIKWYIYLCCFFRRFFRP